MGLSTVKYQRLLRDLHSHLSKYGERNWARVLQDRIAELEQLERAQAPISSYVEHLSRTKAAFGGMGSLNDVSITPQAGYSVPRWKTSWINSKLQKLTTALYNEVLRLEAKAHKDQ